MPVGYLIGLGSGLASALLFYSATRGSPMLGTLLVLLTPLPGLLAGFGWGWMPAAAGAVAGMLVMAFIAYPAFAIGYGMALGLPAALVAYLAYLSRPDPADANLREWYPVGRLVAVVALYAGALPLMILPLIGGTYDILRAPMGEFLRQLSTRAAPDLGIAPLSDAQIASLADLTITVLPGAVATYWFGAFILNIYLAGRIARLSGWLGRDWPDLPTMSFPPGFPLAAAGALAATFAPGLLGVAGSSFTGGLLCAYLVGGLTLMHFIARTRGRWLLWIVYAGLLFFGPYAALVLILAGLLDPAFKLKRRFDAAPPST